MQEVEKKIKLNMFVRESAQQFHVSRNSSNAVDHSQKIEKKTPEWKSCQS